MHVLLKDYFTPKEERYLLKLMFFQTLVNLWFPMKHKRRDSEEIGNEPIGAKMPQIQDKQRIDECKKCISDVAKSSLEIIHSSDSQPGVFGMT